MSRDSFLQGALILAVGNLVSRGLGAVYRFFLPLFLGGGQQAQVGVALFNFAYPLYTILLGVSAAGIPSAIAKLVAEFIARGRARSANTVFRVSLVALALVGLAMTLLLYVAAPVFAARVARDSRATVSIQAIAPAIFVVSVMSAYRGYFQGLQRMVPYALSQVLEQVVRIATMFLFAWMLLPRGIEYAAAGATFGAVTGAAAGLAYLYVIYARHRQVWQVAEPPVEVGHGEARPADIFAQVLRLAVPMSLVGIIQPLMSMIDAAVVPARLHAAGLATQATSLYGILTGYALPFVIAPTVFAGALATSLVPSIAEAVALGNRRSVVYKNEAGIRATLIVVLPAAAGILALAREIPTMFYETPEAGLPLAILGTGAVFLGLQQTSSAVLQGMGAPALPMRNLLVGAAAKLVLTWWLTAIPALNVSGAALGTTVGFLVSAWLNNRCVQGLLEARTAWSRLGGKALASSLVMVLAVRGAYAALLGLVGVKLATLASIAIGVLVYPLVLIVLGGLTARDLELIPVLGPRLGSRLARWQMRRE